MVSLENVFVDDRCFLLALRDKGLNWPIVTRAHAPRHTRSWLRPELVVM